MPHAAVPSRSSPQHVSMPDLPHPVKLAPRYLAKPWGGRRMEGRLGHALPGDEPVGEAWLVHDRDGESSVVADGPLAGARLADLRGDAPFPLLVKLLDASQPLSVQVHPDASAAARLGAEAKTECWFVLHAEPGAHVFRGLRDGCTRADLEDALVDGDVASCLHTVPVAAGDTIFVPAGTVHSIGAGVLLAEVQENSDTTYRLHDWGRPGLDGRPRALHVREALESIHFGRRSEDKVPAQEISDEGSVRRLLLVRSPFFAVEHVTAMGTFTLEAASRAGGVWPVLHVLSGEGELRSFRRNAAPVPFRSGDTLLLPADDETFEVTLGASVLRALVFVR